MCAHVYTHTYTHDDALPIIYVPSVPEWYVNILSTVIYAQRMLQLTHV